MRYFVVDCHPHIYAEDRKKYPPVKDFVDHVEPATTQDLRRRMETNGVDRAVFIQTGTFYQFDNRYVMDSCVEHADWATGVLLLDPDNENDLVVLERAVECGARGLRGQPDKDGKINSAAVFRLWSKAHSLGMVVNCHVGNDHPIEEVEDICARLPDLPIVLDQLSPRLPKPWPTSNGSRSYPMSMPSLQPYRLNIRPNPGPMQTFTVPINQ